MALFCRFSVCHARGQRIVFGYLAKFVNLQFCARRISLALHEQHLQVALKLQAEKAEIIAPS